MRTRYAGHRPLGVLDDPVGGAQPSGTRRVLSPRVRLPVEATERGAARRGPGHPRGLGYLAVHLVIVLSLASGHRPASAEGSDGGRGAMHGPRFESVIEKQLGPHKLVTPRGDLSVEQTEPRYGSVIEKQLGGHELVIPRGDLSVEQTKPRYESVVQKQLGPHKLVTPRRF